MTEHALELLHLALWLVVCLGGAGLGLVSWGGKQVLQRLDIQDKTMVEIKDLLTSEIAGLREIMHELDVRVVRVEERCAVFTTHKLGDNHGS